MPAPATTRPPLKKDPAHPPALRQRVVPAPTLSLCLDFANTRFWRGTEAPTETLGDYAALQQWLAQAGVVDAGAARSLGLLPTADTGAAQQLFTDALQLRELLYRLFGALADSAVAGAEAARSSPAHLERGIQVDAQSLAQTLAGWLAAAPARRQWVFGAAADAGRGWQLDMLTPSASEVLAPVLWSAADLSLALQRVHLRSCANPQCRWLFLDDSKGASRRWCSMSSCGNRAKVRRHFLRHSGRADPEVAPAADPMV